VGTAALGCPPGEARQSAAQREAAHTLNKKQRKRKADKAKAKANHNPTVAPSDIPESAHPHGYAKGEPCKTNPNNTEAAVKKEPLSNWFVVALTAALVLTGFLQWDAIKGQLKAMIDADRPWIGAYLFSAEPLEPSKDGTAKISIVNSGKAPARILSFKTALHMYGNKFPIEPIYDQTQPWTDLSQSILLPGMTGTNEFQFKAFDPVQFQMVIDGKARIYLYGIVEYEDLRVKDSRHTTKICTFWTAKKLSVAFVNCPEYNEANWENHGTTFCKTTPLL